jgi:CO dehydrogenase/acetyl-CoA synthase alpha subunit
MMSMENNVKINMVAKDLHNEDIEDLPCQVTDCAYVVAVKVNDTFEEPVFETGLLATDGDKSIYIHEDGGVEVLVRPLKPGEEPPEED